MRLLRRGPSVRGTWARPFAPDIQRACGDAFRVFGGSRSFLRLPITVPFDDEGRVQLGSSPPKPDAPRVSARLEISRDGDGHDLTLTRVDGRPLLIPGVLDATTGAAAELVRMTCAVTSRGMAIAGTGPTGNPVPLELDETTAQALATALLITIGVKLTKAARARQG